MFIKSSHKDKVLNVMIGLFYCEITDHLPCFRSLKFDKYNRMDERPMTRIFREKIVPFIAQKYNRVTGMKFIRIPKKKVMRNLFHLFMIYINEHLL